MALIDWFASNRVAANLLMLLVVLAGLLCLPTLRQESFPNVPLDVVSIAVRYPGAAPDEVEESVCVPIEETISGVEGVKRVRSRAREGLGNVTAELTRGADRRRVVEDIKTRVGALDTLPIDSRPPVIEELFDNNVLLAVAVYGDVEEQVLREMAERVRDELLDLPEVARAELAGSRRYEVSVELPELELRRHGLRFDEVVSAVRASSLDLPGGHLDTPSAEISLRARGRADDREDFERLVLLTHPDGTRLLLGDVARVVDGFAETDERVTFDGRPAVLVQVLERESRQILAVSRAVGRWLEGARAELPRGVELAIWNDEALPLESRRDLLLRNGAEGLVLVSLLLALLLPARLAFWVCAGIPVAFLGAVAGMSLFDTSINMMSLFAFIVALGLVVDDAIIVGERVAHYQESRSDSPLACAVRGAREVAVPVLIAVLTTALFVAPALVAPTFIGKMARSIPVVVIGCLIFSLVESLLVLPAHLSGGAGAAGGAAAAPRWRALGGARAAAAQALKRLECGIFAPALDVALRWPLLVASVACVALMLSLATVAGGWLRFSFLPEVETDIVSAELVMPQGTPAAVTGAHLQRIENAALRATRDEAGDSILRHVLTAVASEPDEHDDWRQGSDEGNVGRVRLQLVPGEQRSLSSIEVERRWRREVGPVPGALALRFVGSDIGSDPAIDLLLAGRDRAQLARAAGALRRQLAAYPGIREIDDSLTLGKRELELHVHPEAEALGLSLGEVARQVRQGFHGEQAQRIQRGRSDVAVMVRYPAEERRSIANLEATRIRAPSGADLPFAAVASVSERRGYAATERESGRRTVNVRADVDPAVADPKDVTAHLEHEVLPALLAEYPGVSVRAAGKGRDESEMLGSLARWWGFALVVAYALMAAPLRSYVQPLLILLAVPFGFVGAVVGHLAFGLELSAFSIIGLVALTGVVINDALVLSDALRRRLEARWGERGRVVSQAGLVPALREAAMSRFRPILLTSLTTFIGLLPLLFERSAQAMWLKPMAATLAVGVLFATPVTLLLLPAAHVILSRARTRLREDPI
ncbi:MAG: efflux RND transporter permease subunit [Myxococcota bacterium]|nr:efflux RND transporter permease subunit [Myxococcota bacterium]